MTRRTWGALFGLAIVALTVGVSLSYFGFQPTVAQGMHLRWQRDQVVVEAVAPGSEVARAGIVAGDRLHLSGYADAYRLQYVARPARPFAVAVTGPDGSTHVVTLRGDAPPSAASRGFWTALFIIVIFEAPTFLAALLVWRRLSVGTAAFAVYMMFGPLNRQIPMIILAGLPNELFGPIAVALDVLMSVTPLAALLPFLARFPQPTERARPLIRAADVAFVAAVAATAIVTVAALPNLAAARLGQDVVLAIVAVAVAICAVATLVRSTGEARERIAWVLVGMVVTAAAYAFNVARLAAGESLVENATIGIFMAAFPAAVTYAILRHRVLDLGFVLNRGLVYATLTGMLLVAVTLVGWAVDHTIAETRLAVAAEVLVSVGFGLGLTWLHRRVEALIDAVLFRRRRLAAERIEVRIDALDFATDAGVIDAALVSDAARILELASAAVFRIADEGDYRRTDAVGWNDGTTNLGRNDLLVRALLAGEGTRVLDDLDIGGEGFPHGDVRPDLAIPIVLRHRLIAVALYGRHRNGTTLDAIERGMLERLARASASAYDAAEAAHWSRLTLAAPALATS